MPRETLTAPAILPLFSTSGASRTSTTSVFPLLIISRACAGVIFGTAALAASIICLLLVVIGISSLVGNSSCDGRTETDRGEDLTGARGRLQGNGAVSTGTRAGARGITAP